MRGFLNLFLGRKSTEIPGAPVTAGTARSWAYVERPCIGCLHPHKFWGTDAVPLINQFCSKRCKNAFFHGYHLGTRLYEDVSQRWGRNPRVRGTL